MKTLSRKNFTLGKYLQTCRISAGLTQEQVANALGYSSAQFISNVERDYANPPLAKIYKWVTLIRAHRRLVGEALIQKYAREVRKELGT